MRRREFLFGLGGAAASPVLARAQQQVMPVVGFLNGASPSNYGRMVAAFRQGLMEAGFVEGQNVAIEYRWAEGHYDRLPDMAIDLVRRQVAVIAANTPAAPAAKAATTKIPIVFASGSDPVASGLVASFNQPGGNLTGMSLISDEVGAKQLGLLRELMPAVTLIGLLVNTASPTAGPNVRDVQQAANTIGQPTRRLNATNTDEIELAFATLAQIPGAALIVIADTFFIARREQLVALAARHSLPTVYSFSDFAAAGGLMSYGASLADGYRQVGNYTGRILKGENPAGLPVVRPTKFELVINLKTAKALGIDVPPTLLARADDVIE